MNDYQLYQTLINHPTKASIIIQTITGIDIQSLYLEMHHQTNVHDFQYFYLAYLINHHIHLGLQLGNIQNQLIEMMVAAMVEVPQATVNYDIEIIISSIPWGIHDIECFELSNHQWLIAFSRKDHFPYQHIKQLCDQL